MKLPKKNQWRQFFKVLSRKERFIFFIFFFLFLSSLTFISVNIYYNNTKIVPAEGGEYVEGLVGSPRFINPIYALLSDVDRDLVELIFSGLMKYDSEGNLQPDLAKEYKILENGKIYEFYLKENLFWQDSRPLTVDDVIFTIESIQNPDVKSPLRAAWLGVEVEKISDFILRFKLKNESYIFLENCTLKIIPKHIWKNIPAQNFPLATMNLSPVGSGPYKLQNLSKNGKDEIISLDLVQNSLYYDKKPYIPKISFRLFDSEEKLMSAYQRGEIKGFSLTTINDFKTDEDFLNLHSFYLPRYFVVFFNQKNSKLLPEKNVRVALNYGTNKNEILEKVLFGYGRTVQSPILPEIYGFKEPTNIYTFNVDKAVELLEDSGFLINETGIRERITKKELPFQFKSTLSLGSRGSEVTELQKCLARDPEVYPEGEITGYFGEKTKEAVIKFQEKYSQDILKPFGLEKGTGEVKVKTREKLNTVCFEKPEEKILFKFSLTTVDDPDLIKVAEILKEQWKKLGAEIEIKAFDVNALEREVLRKRDFEALLFGEVLSLTPDLFPFWHSSQGGEFGLNIANYENKNCDRLLEDARKTLDAKERKEKLEQFQEILIEDAPTIFLYNPDYLYFVSREIKGIKEGVIANPSKRFNDIGNWYIKTKRAWK